MMHPSVHESSTWSPSSEEEKSRVLQQLNRLLDTSHFKNSRRYPALFRFVVEETLEGRGEFLKERLLGVRVFDRPADYDTASDPIVRVTIAEIRKRIAQYYHEEAHASELRIELVPGRYTPEFREQKEQETDTGSEALEKLFRAPAEVRAAPVVEGAVAGSAATRKPPLLRMGLRIRHGIYLAAVLLLAAGSFLTWRWTRISSVEEVWGPVLAAPGSITLCLPQPYIKNDSSPVTIEELTSGSGKGTAGSGKPSFRDHENGGENVVFSDVLAALKVSDSLASHARDHKLRLSAAMTLEDLRDGPVILIGGLDNPWTMRALGSLRYRFADNGPDVYSIIDTRNPSRKNWSLDLKSGYATVTHDYAIIARFHNESTGQIEVIAAGIGMSGTAAAGEFLVDPKQVQALHREVGRSIRDRDFEAVLQTDVVDGSAGSPKILAVTVW